jgi:hypothetical protein
LSPRPAADVELVVAGDKLGVEFSRRMMDFHMSQKNLVAAWTENF